ncbi:SUN domain-containing ossification factor isoform 2-T2 [Synchiropus picturatus]
MMKRLRVLLVCLIVALLCWYPNNHVCGSEPTKSNSGPPVPDPSAEDYKQEQDVNLLSVEEKGTTHTNHDSEQVTEKTTLEKPDRDDVVPQQTVNQLEDELKETKSHLIPNTNVDISEPRPKTQAHDDLDLQADTQDHNKEAPIPLTSDSIPVQDPSTEASSEAAVVHHTSDLNHNPPDEAESTPTSESAGSPPTGVDQAEVVDNHSRQSQNSAQQEEVHSTIGHTEHEQQPPQNETAKGGLSDSVHEGNTSQDSPELQSKDAVVSRETDPSVPSKEDIPTFDEWKKQVMEVEKEKSQFQVRSASVNNSPHPTKKVQKNFKNNYASVECGAKILSANNEAKSTSAILMENMDLYMLNPCSNKIWFVIELCEPIQVKQLDIANFELFSSTPKDFLVSISDRYPTNKWVKLGTFHARDERIVQSFPLDEQLYAKYVKMFIKYIKVELLSHFGSEHFCPLSLIRVFGTSMVEEYEEIADSQYPSERLEYLDEDYDYPPGYQPPEDKDSKNIIGTATDAILNMVNNIAANVLGGSPELEGSAETRGNTTTDSLNARTDIAPETTEDAQVKTQQHLIEPEDTVNEKHSNMSTDSSSLSPSSPEPRVDQQIVTPLEGEEEEEEHRQSTVTLMEEELEEEEPKREEKTKGEANNNQWESQTYCPFSSLSSLSLSCMATLPELLHRWCSARLAKERLRSLRRRHLSTQIHSDLSAASLSRTLPHISLFSTSLNDPQQIIQKSAELEMSGQNKGDALNEGHTSYSNLNSHAPDTHTPEHSIILEPSITATIPSHSLADSHSSFTRPTPTPEEALLPKIKDETVNPAPSLPFHVVSIPETQLASSATPTLTLSSPPQILVSETASPGVLPSLVQEPLVPPLSAASRLEDLSTPPTEVLVELPVTDTAADSAKAPGESGDLLRNEVSRTNIEQEDPLAQATEMNKVEETIEEELMNSNGHGSIHRTATDFYAELQNGDYNSGAGHGNNGNVVLLNGGTVHGSSQKESVFMRLNNRIKALEMNMSLSSRYLEELSQRYRKQMEEMQRAFNKTIIKLQNTSRIAEEQDHKQTDSIQVLQSQLESVTKLMLNLTNTVNQLQKEVSDRQSYLVVSLVLCLLLGLVLCLQCCRSSPVAPLPKHAALPMSNHFPSPKRCFSSYDDMSLKRRVTCPLVRSKSFHLSSTEGPDDLYIVEPLRFSPEKKKKRCKSKSLDKVETLKASDPSAPLVNGEIKCNGFHPSPPSPTPSPAIPLPPPPPPPSLKEESQPLVETSSCSSSTISEESYTSRHPPPSPVQTVPGLCNGHEPPFLLLPPAAKNRQEKRSMKRRKSRQTELLLPPIPGGRVGSLPCLEQLMKRNEEIGVGTIRVTPVTGHV